MNHGKVASCQERINELFDSLTLTDTGIAESLGVSKQTVSAWRTGVRSPKRSMLETLSEKYRVDVAWLMGYDVPRYGEREDFDAISLPGVMPISKRRVPLLGGIVCGEPAFAEEEFESYVAVGTNVHADYCLKAHGDSMIGARIMDGDIVFIRKQDMVENGEIAAVLIGDETTLKRVYYDPDNQVLSLVAENPRFKTLRYMGAELDQVRILGKAVAFQSDVR